MGKSKLTVEDRVARIEVELSKLVTTRQLMERFGVSQKTVSNWVRNGDLHGVPGPMGMGYVFSPDEIENFQRPRRGNPNHRKVAS